MKGQTKSSFSTGLEPVWNHLWSPVRHFASAVADYFSPAADARDADNAYVLSLELPGVQEKDIDVSLSGDTLTVRGEKREEKSESHEGYFFSERRYGHFERSFELPSDVDRDAIEASFKDGVLSLSLPRTETKAPSAKKIAVKPH
ncbi:Hsp20/alpha crystallin family protein [Kordiimonas marina]|uniref:Hsp20/alpha crystallin family protein n=1 Tax=Kordiimonas marina TaxID=2872312 RepID=UPI001FF108A9|nr:Hsp20/alpha crystallin family protein [Kordiimonas marina]MCJ9429524.1 Hsp20/alpha crystallin family protein [Kordiimonas marina]